MGAKGTLLLSKQITRKIKPMMSPGCLGPLMARATSQPQLFIPHYGTLWYNWNIKYVTFIMKSYGLQT